MKREIFAAEIKKSSRNQRDVFTEEELCTCLNTLSTTYDEVLMLPHRDRVLVLVVGLSRSYMVQVLAKMMTDVEKVHLSSSSDEAIIFLLGVARGLRWTELDMRSIRQLISNAARQSMVLNCLGESLNSLVEFSLKVNATQLKTIEHLSGGRTLQEPVTTSFKFSTLSNN